MGGHDLHGISYIAMPFLSCSILSLGCARSCRSFVCGFTAVSILCFLMILCFCDSPDVSYGHYIFVFLVCCVLFFSFAYFPFIWLVVFLELWPFLHIGRVWVHIGWVFPSSCLSSSSVMMLARSYRVRPTGILCTVGRSDVQSAYESVGVAFL